MTGMKMTVTLPSPPYIGDPGVAKRVQERFLREASTAVIDAIRNHLGSASIYQLEPEYSKRKPFLNEFRRFPGKPRDQPLILTGEMYEALTAVTQGNTVVIEVQEGKALAPDGFDYAEWFEEIVSYLELGLYDVEMMFDQLLLDIVFEEMDL